MASGILNPAHIALVLVVVLMLFGAKRLPEMGRSLGTGLRGFKQSLEGIAEEENTRLAPTDQGPTPSGTGGAASPSPGSVGERPNPDQRSTTSA